MPTARCPICKRMMLAKNLRRHYDYMVSKDPSDRAHADALHGLPAGSGPAPGTRPSPVKWENASQSSPGKTQGPTPGAFNLPEVPRVGASSPAPETSPGSVSGLEFPAAAPGTSYTAVPTAAPARLEIPSENWQNLLETIFDWSLAVRDGKFESLGKLSAKDYELLARAIARKRGKDLEESYVLLVAGAKFAIVVMGNFIVGIGKMLKAARAKKEAALKAKTEADRAAAETVSAASPAPG